MVDPAELSRCRISDCVTCGVSGTPATKDILAQLLQSPLVKQTFQDPRLLQQILQQNYIAQMGESTGLLSSDMAAQRSLHALRSDCGSTGSLPSYMTMNFGNQQSGDKSASISPSQLSNPPYAQDNLQLSREPSLTSGDYGRLALDRISPAEAVVGANTSAESTPQSRKGSGICQTDSGVQSLFLDESANVVEESDHSFRSPAASSFIAVSEHEQPTQRSTSSLVRQVSTLISLLWLLKAIVKDAQNPKFWIARFMVFSN